MSTIVPTQAGAWTAVDWRAIGSESPLNGLRRAITYPGGTVAASSTALLYSADDQGWEQAPITGLIAFAVLGDRPLALTLNATIVSPGWDWTGGDLGSGHFVPPLTAWARNVDGTLRWHSTVVPITGVRSSTRAPRLASNGKVAVIVIDDNDKVAVARSTDGVSWDFVQGGELPPSLDQWSLSSIGGVFLLFGQGRFNSDGRVLVFSSVDGVTWHELDVFGDRAPHVVEARVVAMASGGAIVAATTDLTPGPTWWFQSSDGLSWRSVDNLFPLGAMPTNRPGGGQLPAGTLAGNGERMVAYDTVNAASAWTSLDGLTWTPLTITGDAPTFSHLPNASLTVLRNGLVTSSNTDTWLATASYR